MKTESITLTGDRNVELMEQLCQVTGLDSSNLVALLLRKYGKDLEMWINYPSSFQAVPVQTVATPVITKLPLELPTDSGEGLPPVAL